MQCGRRFPPWPTGSADGPHLVRVVASGEAGVAGPGWVRVGGALGWVVASGEAGVAGPGWVRVRSALALVLPSRPSPGWIGCRSPLAPVVIFRPAPVVISSVAVPTSCRHRVSLSPESCTGPAPSPPAECDHQPGGGKDDQRRADQVRVAKRRARCRGRAWLGWPTRTARGGGGGPEAACGRGRTCPHSGEGRGDDKCRRADMRDRSQQASCGAAETPAGGHCLRLSCRHVRTACAFPQAHGRVPIGLRLGSTAARHLPLTQP
jgi:hypothetical protein